MAAGKPVGRCACAVLVAWVASGQAISSQRQTCDWTPPATAQTVVVQSVAELRDAVRRAGPNTTILIAAGHYELDAMLDLSVPGLTLRGATGESSAVVLRGRGMADRKVGVALSVSASDVTIADLTVTDVAFHGIQIRGERGASGVVIHNVHVRDAGQQLIKGSSDGSARRSVGVTIACSTFEYTEHAPSSYTNAISVLGGRDWVVRDNGFYRIRGPASQGFAAGPAILFWGGSSGTVVERNTVVDSFRGVAFGLGPRKAAGSATADHIGGSIRGNVIVNRQPWADEGIEANAAVDVAIDRNTVITAGPLPWSISLRFPQTSAVVRHNVTSRPIVRRDGGQAVTEANVLAAGLVTATR